MVSSFRSRVFAAALGAVMTMAVPNFAFAQSSTITGTLEVIVKDDFDRGRSERVYFVRDQRDDAMYELQFDRTPPGNLLTGRKITVRGRAVGRKMEVDSLDAGAEPTTVTGDAEVAPAAQRRAVVILVSMNDAVNGYTVDQITANMFTGARSVDGLYRASSQGQLGFPADTDGNGAPDVFGPFTINESGGSGDYYAWAYAAEAAATAAGVDLSLYQHRVFVLPRYNQLNISWAGIANVGCGSYCRSWIAEGESPMVFAHELGHNLAMAHAGTDPENDGTTNSAYGDYSDPMGLSRAWHGFNGAHIDQMGWFNAFPGAVSTVISGGTYQIAAIGSDPNGAAPQVIKIEKTDTGNFYYLTYRQPTGYDDSLSGTYTQGVNIHHYRGSGYSATNHVLTLTDGGAFQDPANDITITQLSQDGATATIQVTYVLTCNETTPSVGISPSMHLVRPGEVVDFSASVTNQDSNGCGQTIFGLTQDGMATGALNASSLTLAAGQAGTATIRVDTTGLADGSYDTRLSATDIDGADPVHLASGTRDFSIVVDGIAPTAPTGLSGSVARKNKVNLSWNASFDAVSGVAAYTIYRDGVVIGQTGSTGFTDSGATSGAAYGYTVIATDGVGNASPASAPVTITVTSTKGGGAKGGGGGGGKGRKK